MWRDECQPFQARKPPDRSAEIAEICAGAISPCIHRLADKRDFPSSSSDPFAYFFHDGVLRPVIEAAAHVWNDAEGTIVGTTALYRNECAQMSERIGYSVGRAAEREFKHVVGTVVRSRSMQFVAGGVKGPCGELVAELHQLPRAENRVHVRCPLPQPFADLVPPNSPLPPDGHLDPRPSMR